MANTFKFGNKKWAVKKDYVLAYNDESNNFKPLPFDFTRDSTATYVDSDGLIKTAGDGIARIDYTDNSDGHLLLEPSRTQLIQYSEDFSQTYWIKTRITVTVNQAISPDGNNTADYLEQTSGETVSGAVVKLIAFTAASYTFSVFAKKKEKTFLRLAEASSSGNGAVSSTYFDLDDGTIGTSHSNHTAKMDNFGNGWYRCAITFTGTAANNNAIIYIADSDNSSTVTDSGGIYIFGSQLEVGSYATSYIPTSGTSVTRAADVCNGAGNSEVFNDSEGVFFVNAAALNNDGSFRTFSINSGATTNSILIGYANTSNSVIAETKVAGTKVQGNTVSVTSALDFNKMAIKYKLNDYSLYVNGSELDTDTSASVPTGLDELDVDRGDGVIPFYGKIKDIRVYNTALSDSELATLTT